MKVAGKKFSTFPTFSNAVDIDDPRASKRSRVAVTTFPTFTDSGAMFTRKLPANGAFVSIGNVGNIFPGPSVQCDGTARPLTEPKTEPTKKVPVSPPREPREIGKQLRYGEGDDDFCHLLLFGDRTACGLRLSSERIAGAHHDPDRRKSGITHCSACGRPRCPKCEHTRTGR